MKKYLICLLAFSFQTIATQDIKPDFDIIQKPILFDQQRKDLTLEYMQAHYGIVQDEPTIKPTMITVHWTVIPTFEKTFNAFNSATLPAARSKISSAGALNVSSQFVIDRDGTIYQLMPETIMARHVIGLNYTAIGIENIADGDSLPMTDAQLEANTKLIKYLARKYPIDYVFGHSEYQHFKGTPLWKEKDDNYLTEKNDPDAEFMGKLRSRLTDLKLSPLPN
ncbi:peptidoglycan recognition family protein [Neptunicella sp. SCSIO 80796]|uniref:peptidoglycan recognition protein family protein n=1 Tax=Neptunicella plasticusilytica TaxID=3117012 RepID=UPI003A4D69C5